MKFLRIFFFTLVWAFLGFIVGYLLFARWGNEFIPIKSIFMSNKVEDAVIEGWMRIRLKICGTSAAFGFAGLLAILFIEFRGRVMRAEQPDFYECKHCGFKSEEKTPFCIACDRDANGLTKEDYKKRAAEKLSRP